MSVPPQLQKVLDDVDKRLHEPSPITNVLATVEQKTGLRRLHLVLGAVGLQALYLVFGHFAALVCNTMGFIYPAYCSVIAIESHHKEDDTQWLTYWVVFAILSVVEFFSNTIVNVFPVYWLFKAFFLLWLYLPSTLGATVLYSRFVQPIMRKHNKTAEQHVQQFANKAHDAARRAVNEVNQHLD